MYRPDEFRVEDVARMHALMRAPLIFDGRNLFDRARMRQAGFDYYSVGRPAVEGVAAGAD